MNTINREYNIWPFTNFSNLKKLKFYDKNNIFLYNISTRCTNFSNLFWKENLHISDISSVLHREFFTVHTAMVYVMRFFFLTACKQDQNGTVFHSDPARKKSAKLYDIYHFCVYSEKFLMMDRGTVRNM